MSKPKSRSFYVVVVKRIADILIGLIALPFLALIVLLVGLAIKLDDGGPVFYRAKRIGKDSKIFDMYKFRSMVVNAPNYTNKDGSTYNAPDDNRVTKVGKFIRKTSVDELPQFFNVLIGNMTFIGPRASGAGALDNYLDDEKAKMEVKPGITGFTQAYYRNGLTVREKRLKDAWYAQNVTFVLDVKIFFKTIVTVLKREQVYTNSAGVNIAELQVDTVTVGENRDTVVR
ncbi:MAG: sugar transferase [Acutalibacteraceae bacterium]|nr:sugar transferase [Acutalibacteraceae bacterium]